MSENSDANSPNPTNSEPQPLSPADFAADDPETPDSPPDNTPPDTSNAVVEGDDEPAEPPKAAKTATDDDPIGDDDDTPADGEDSPPEFWSAERKALWEKVTDPEVRAAIRDHVREVSTATSKRLEESAGKVRQAEESAKQAIANQNADIQWWQQNGPILQQIIEGEFANIDWNKLSSEDPAAYVRVQEAKKQREAWLQGVVGRLAQRQKQQAENAQSVISEHRAAEHGKLAAKYPREFGDTKTAQRTYDVLSKYLVDNGIPPERVPTVYESPVVEIVMKAYKWDRAKAKAKEITSPKPLSQPASKTPTRIVPGARNSANPADEATRQAMERLRSGVKLTPEQAALAFR